MTAPWDTIGLLKQLVAFDTTSRNSNLDCIHFIRDYLDSHGVESRLTFDDENRKANLFATLCPAERPGIVLSGHTDIVPVDGQDWNTDPFDLVLEGDKLYGRGTCDMKGFIAVCLAAAPEILRRRPRSPFHFAFSFDEEVGCLGVPRLIADMMSHLSHRPRACFVGEPTGMGVVDGHKGKTSVRCRVRGHESHSALTHMGVNAIEAAAEIIARLSAIGRHLKENGPHDDGYEPPYTTVHTGIIRGGTALNIVPGNCEFDFEFRTLPKHDIRPLLGEVERYVREELLPRMRQVAPETGVRFETLSTFPGLETDPQSEAVQLAKSLTGANSTAKVSFGTEAGLFHSARIPTVVCGPGHIEQAHKPNEFVTREQLARCEEFVRGLIDRMCA